VVWLLQQRRGTVTIADISKRDDVTEVNIPVNCKGWVTGNRGSELRRMEQVTGTYMFMALDSRGEERLLIFGVNPGSKHSEGGTGRAQAERMVQEMVREKIHDDGQRRGRGRSSSSSPEARGGGGKKDVRRDSRSCSRSRSRSRTPKAGRKMRGWGATDRDK